MWNYARYFFWLTLEEFGELTLPEFWDLWEMRAIDFKRGAFLQGVTASAVYNVHRTDEKQHVFTPFDFVSRSEEEEQHDELVMLLKKTTAPLRLAHPERILEARERCLRDLTSRGVANADDIVNEVFGE